MLATCMYDTSTVLPTASRFAIFFSCHQHDASMNSEMFHYKRGANQTFSQTTHIVQWVYNADKKVIPVVIQCVVEDKGEKVMHVSISKVH